MVGIFHETYKVEAGAHESVYGNMPLFGLAAAMSHVPAVGRRETARRRMGGRLNAREGTRYSQRVTKTHNGFIIGRGMIYHAPTYPS